MHDTVIRGGTIVDGTGKQAFTGDIAIDGDRIAEVGGKAGPAKRDIDADGMLVTPGWVDVHTHYDGQATWDKELAPSSWHGVTTILFGNCGVGFAPVRREHHASLIGLMEAVEEIPGITLSEGLKWDWESFPQYLDALERMPRAIDVAAQVPHHPLRVYVMGERAINREKATAEDIEAMRRMTREALEAGAFGFTTSRTNSHKTPTGEMVPGRYSEVQELLGIGSALKGLRHGAFGVNSDFDIESEELAWMTQLGQETGRPVWFLLTDRPTDPVRWQRLMEGVRTARAQGAFVTAQVAGRPVGVMLGVDTALNPFSIRPSYQELLKLPAAERLARLQDPAMRAAILADEPSAELVRRLSQFRMQITTRWDRMFVMGDPPDYEPEASSSIAAMAKRSNHYAGRGGVRLPGGRAGQVPVLPDRRLQRGQPRHHPHHADLAGDGAGAVGWRRALLLDQRCQRAELDAGALGARPEARPGAAAGAGRQAADQRDGGLLRLRRSRPAGARAEGGRQRDRLRAPAPACAGDPLRPARRWTPAGAARRWLHRDARIRHAGVRARPVHRRDARQAGARRIDPVPAPSPREGEGRRDAHRARYVRWHAAQTSPTTLTCAATPSASPALASSDSFVVASTSSFAVFRKPSRSLQTAGSARVLWPCSVPGGNCVGNCRIHRAIALAGPSSVFTSPLAATTARISV